MTLTGNNRIHYNNNTSLNGYSFESWFDFSNEDCTSQIVSQEREHHVLSMLHQVSSLFLFDLEQGPLQLSLFTGRSFLRFYCEDSKQM